MVRKSLAILRVNIFPRCRDANFMSVSRDQDDFAVNCYTLCIRHAYPLSHTMGVRVGNGRVGWVRKNALDREL